MTSGISIPTEQERPTVSIKFSAEAMGVSLATAYAAARSGDLPTIRMGKRILVPTAALRRLLQLDAHDHDPPVDRAAVIAAGTHL